MSQDDRMTFAVKASGKWTAAFPIFSSFIRKNNLLVYFCLAFLITWTFWFFEPSMRTKDGLTATLLVQLGTYGPALAAMLLSSLSDGKRVDRNLLPGIAAVLIVLVLAVYANWSTIKSLSFNLANLHHWLLLAAVILLPAWIFFNVFSRIRGVNRLLKSLLSWRGNPLWFFAALFLMFFLSTLGLLLTSLFQAGLLHAWLVDLRTNPVLQNLPIVFIATALFGGPLGEECGWRGYALPHLQKRFDPFLASVILGGIWAVWHFPLHLSGYYDQAFGNPLNGIILRVFTSIPLAIVFTWLYNRSGGNLLAMVILHTATNITSAIIAPGMGMYLTVTLAVVLMIVGDRMYRKSGLSAAPPEIQSI